MSDLPAVLKAGGSRVWYVEGGVHPFHVPTMMPLVKLNDPTWNLGETTRIEAPDPTEYNSFVEVGQSKGANERPTFGLDGRYPVTLSELLRLTRKGCRIDVYGLFGECRNPQDFTDGWEKVMFFPDGDISTYSGENFGALQSDDQNPANESVELTANEIWEFGHQAFGSKIASAEAAREILAIDVCDSPTCGGCGELSDGCQKVLAVMAGTGATPGTLPILLFSKDGGDNWSSQNISTIFSSETPSGAACIGGDYVVIVEDSNSLHYTELDDLFLDESNIWIEVNSGFVTGNGPRAISSCSPRHTWIAGANGYIYFSQSPSMSVVVQDAGVATTQNLNDIHAMNTKNVLTVGDLNAVAYTRNGGSAWETVTGPAVGIALTACWMWGEDVWIVGTADGRIFKTEDAGVNWVESEYPLTAGGRIEAIEFVGEAEGYVSVSISGTGYLLRTVTGGYEWFVTPQVKGSKLLGADKFNDIAVCDVGDNIVFVGGLDEDDTTGYIAKGDVARGAVS